MDLRKLPPSMLLTLGLACGPGKGSDETTVSACLSPATTDEPSTGSGSDTDIDTGPCLDVGPCLGMPDTTGTTGTTGGSGDSTFGPCLSPEPPTSTDTGSDSGSGSDTGSGSDSGTTGAMEDEPAPSRAAALERVLERGTLPADVAARLRSRSR